MGKDKLRKFKEIETFTNVLQLDAGKPMQGRWATDHFGNDRPIVLELACGKGEYTVNLAKLFPERNFIGIDYKGNRIWRGAKTAIEEDISNVAFLRIQIETILDYFAPGEVAEIWITFPDPQPQKSREKKRLTHPVFLARYRQLMVPEGVMHLKTDNDGLYAYTLAQLTAQGLPIRAQTTDLYHSDLVDEVLSIKTYYERKYLEVAKNINYVTWGWP
ncbi:tRNA (guanosine(46)-N7)-methyltransferase TrmB [Parapedobacter sp. 10938]|uniref:tRNA (guanosine(46)-N7)-methyltransferase TrmB n=1 Tax=Parapedobacter flavus TaxID=3110225 RepID=UPI002DBE49C7|nr:tRNA (guanosine(46)-N7)-methyltransferase TrmB [Parapedobacter sp. 10938]MEC3880110.1 tRNA (guanosine(46)-N7)-methyltransferase TrmB [Parapedobacter sp. 10938]